MLDGLKRGGNLICHRCGNDLDKEKWNSEWDPSKPDDHHYKSFVCDCGKKNWVRVNFPGSGHDRVLQEEEDSIESAVSKVKGGLLDKE